MSEVGVTVKFAAGEFAFLTAELDKHREALLEEAERQDDLGRTVVATGIRRRVGMIQELLSDLSR